MTALLSADLQLQQADDLLLQRELASALCAVDEAEAAGAGPDDCAARRWMLFMLQGAFERAWQQSDKIRARGGADPHRFWNGEDFTGKRVVVRCLHGFGDTVQFLRYAPQLAARAASVTFEVPPAMLEFAGLFQGVSQVITWGDGAPERPPAYGVQMEINELPYLFRTTEQTLPVAERYLVLPEAGPSHTIKPNAPDSLRVGLVWASSAWNTDRSVPPHLLQPLFDTPGVEFWNLQGDPARNDAAQFGTLPHAHRADACVTSMVVFAQHMQQMDLLITTDTLAAHVAGALGLPAWVMLKHDADWRWQHARTDSPWYPSLRLFRQTTPGDWQGVLIRVQQALAERARMHRAQAVSPPAGGGQ